MRKLWAKLDGTTVTVYPYTSQDLKSEFPEKSFREGAKEDSYFLEAGCVEVMRSSMPEFNTALYKCVEETPVFSDTVLVQTWTVVPLLPSEIEVRKNRIKQEIIDQVQLRLDEFAQSRNYHNMLSACTYATSADPRFSAEGQHCVDLRDATWNVLYTVLAEVEAETRPMPQGFADIESELPILTWED